MLELLGADGIRDLEDVRAVRYLVWSDLSPPTLPGPGMEMAKLYKDNHNLFVILQLSAEQTRDPGPR